MKQKHYIDLHKGATFIYILVLMYIFNNNSNPNNMNIYIYTQDYMGLMEFYGF